MPTKKQHFAIYFLVRPMSHNGLQWVDTDNVLKESSNSKWPSLRAFTTQARVTNTEEWDNS